DTSKSSTVAEIIELLDIRQVQIKLTIGVRSEFYDRTWIQSGNVETGGSMDMMSEDFGWNIHVRPSINRDGSVVGKVSITYPKFNATDTKTFLASTSTIGVLSNDVFSGF